MLQAVLVTMPHEDPAYLSPLPSPFLSQTSLLTKDITPTSGEILADDLFFQSDNSLLDDSPTALSSSNSFPPLPYDASSPSRFSKPFHYAYLPPMRYSVLQWPTLWNKPPLRLDDYEPTSPIWELEFEAIPFRICVQNNNLPGVYRGQVVNYGESNSNEQRYMVEYCQLVQNEVAYLKIVCRDKHQNVFPPYHPDFPAFMLLIPASSSFVSYPENLQEYESNLNSSTELQGKCYAGGCC